MSSTELWRAVPDYEGLYEVSDAGSVRSLPRPHCRGRTLQQISTPKGYLVVSLSRHGNVRQWRVHQLVMMAFIGPPPSRHEVCHRNGRPSDNRLSNLRYDTHSGNQLDLAKHGTHCKAAQSRCIRGHQFTQENTLVTTRNQRRCRACHREDERAEYREAKTRRDSDSMSTAFPGEYCKHGHEYTAENTYITPAGKRTCRECRRAVLRRQHYKRMAARDERRDVETGDGRLSVA